MRWVGAGPIDGATPRPWSLVLTPPAEAAWNMACDHALAESVGRGDSHPVLRLFSWQPPAVSWGYNQPVRDRREALEGLRSRGLGLVRRPTGGAAVLHRDEVTYSAIVGPAHFATADGSSARDSRAPNRSRMPAASLWETCERIHAAVLAGLESLGISGLALHGRTPAARRPALAGSATPVSASPPGRGSDPVCFAVQSRSEIAWHGRKLVGSAQRRVAGAILQHGSIPLSGGQSELDSIWPRHISELPGTMNPDAPKRSLSTNLSEAGGRRFARDGVAAAVQWGFERELSAAFEPRSLTNDEAGRIQLLVTERYGREEFLYRV